jgi:large subunit ribosomal protein L12
MEYIHAALLLHELGKEINEENLKKVISSVSEVDEAKIKTLIASLKDVDIDKAIKETAVTAQPQVKEEKPKEKEEKKEESSTEGLAALFG